MENKVVLLIEDNPDDERLTLRALRKNNIMNEVVVAGDGQQALDYLFATGAYESRNALEMPALIVLDLRLPGISGLEVLQIIRADERTKLIPVVVLSCAQDPADVGACYDCGANSYIRKPVDAAEFSETVLNIGMYWLLLNQAPQQTG
jgi:CheY-like chemotaxis protein